MKAITLIVFCVMAVLIGSLSQENKSIRDELAKAQSAYACPLPENGEMMHMMFVDGRAECSITKNGMPKRITKKVTI